MIPEKGCMARIAYLPPKGGGPRECVDPECPQTGPHLRFCTILQCRARSYLVPEPERSSARRRMGGSKLGTRLRKLWHDTWFWLHRKVTDQADTGVRKHLTLCAAGRWCIGRCVRAMVFSQVYRNAMRCQSRSTLLQKVPCTPQDLVP